MIRTTTLLLTVSLSLIMSAITAQAAPKKNPPPPPPPLPIPISFLPFTISAPGTYVFTGNLTATTKIGAAALGIATGISGPVVLDLRGFTLTSVGPDSVGITIGGFDGDLDTSNPYPIAIQNGTVANASFGVWVGPVYR